MVTNQPDVGRGAVPAEVARAANDYVVTSLQLDFGMACFHDDADRCACRKPLPGMLIEAARQHALVLDRGSYMVGDRWRDVDAGAAAGVTTIFIDHGYEEVLRSHPDRTVSSLVDAAAWIQERDRATES